MTNLDDYIKQIQQEADNRRATEIAHSYGTLFPGDYISGNVILCDNDMVR